MLSQKLEMIFNKAVRKANERKHEFLTLENILLALLEDPGVSQVISDCGGDLPWIKNELLKFLANDENFSLLTEEQVEELGNRQFVNPELREIARHNGVRYQPELSLGLQRVIQRAALHIQSSGKKSINPLNVLVSFFSEKESYAIYLLETSGVTRMKVVERIAHSDEAATNTVEGEEAEKSDQDPLKKEDKYEKALSEYTANLNELALQGKIDPIVGRHDEIERVVQIFCRRRKNNPLLVGDAGVGKTAIAEGLALAIVEKKVPEMLQDTVIYSLDMASLLAGTKFRGDFEERIKLVLKALEKKNGGKKAASILFIDEIHTIIGAGATSGGSMDASNLMKPALTKGTLRCFGSTTFEEYRKYFEKDQALTRRFQKVEVLEPTVPDTIKILEGLKPKFEEFHGIQYDSEVLKAAAEMSEKYVTDRKLPDKAIDVIDEIGAYLQLLPIEKKRTKASIKDVEDVVAKIARIPKNSVEVSEKERMKSLERDLKFLIFGQDHAIDKTISHIYMARSGLGNKDKPMASFLFVGPTGVGKTELARQLSRILGIHFERFDMSEFMEKHAVSKLIGAPPGYVGFEQGGTLTEAINKHPHSVLLLDEIEKAHPDIFNVLLQVMDHGMLTDSNGRTVNFRNTIIIMTSNAGAKDFDEGSIGLAKIAQGNESKRDKVIKNFFAPEFRNRLDSIVYFQGLKQENILMIVDKFLFELENQLHEKNVELEVSGNARKWLADLGYDVKLGARPIARVIDEKVKRVLASEILFGKLEHGGKVVIDVNENSEEKIQFTFHAPITA
jgi:ATP-dependent Clp protease ATP-binding subunit ClpA